MLAAVVMARARISTPLFDGCKDRNGCIARRNLCLVATNLQEAVSIAVVRSSTLAAVKAHDGVTGADTQKTAEKAVQADLPWLTHELRRPPVTRADSAAAAWAAVRIYENEVMLDPVLLRTWTTPRVPAVMQL